LSLGIASLPRPKAEVELLQVDASVPAVPFGSSPGLDWRGVPVRFAGQRGAAWARSRPNAQLPEPLKGQWVPGHGISSVST
jgi:hypothetical protein